MSDSAQAGDVSAMQQKLDSLQREALDLKAALAAGRSIRILLLLLTIAFVGGFSYLFYQMGNQLKSKQSVDKLMAELEAKSPEIMQDLTSEVKRIVDNAGPKVKDAYFAQFEKDAELYVAEFDKQRQPLIDNLQRELNSVLNAHYEKILASHADVLKEEFKSEITDDKDFVRMTDNFNLAVHQLIKEFYVERMKKEFLALYKLWDEFPPAEAPKQGEPTIGSQIVGHLFEFFKEAMVKYDAKSGDIK